MHNSIFELIYTVAIVILQLMHAHTDLATAPQTNEKVLQHIDRHRMECPDGCPDHVYSIMQECWEKEPMQRPNFTRVDRLLQHVKEQPESKFENQI